MRPSVLAERLHIAARSATEVVDALEERGLVERGPDPDDRRATLVGRPTRPAPSWPRSTASAASSPSGSWRCSAERDRTTLDRILRILVDQ